MISKPEAYRIAKAYLEDGRTEGDPAIVLFEEPVAEGAFGWVFSYQNAEFLRSGGISDALAGNAPVLIDAKTGEAFETGTAHAVETYVDAYIATGDPSGSLGRCVRLEGWKEGANKVQATKAIKAACGIGLKEARDAVEHCMEDGSATLACKTWSDAAALTKQLNQLGFPARHLPEHPLRKGSSLPSSTKVF